MQFFIYRDIFNKMLLKEIAVVQSGYISRGKIEPEDGGSHFLLQARDVDGKGQSYARKNLTRFNPHLSPSDWTLQRYDILFIARGFKNFSVLIQEIPHNVLAAACFFVVRAQTEKVLPEYLCWYLNQLPVEDYLRRRIGRGVNMPIVRRAVLESIDIPLPPMETQRTVAELNKLIAYEQALLTSLTEKRKTLIAGVCLKAVQKHEG